MGLHRTYQSLCPQLTAVSFFQKLLFLSCLRHCNCAVHPAVSSNLCCPHHLGTGYPRRDCHFVAIDLCRRHPCRRHDSHLSAHDHRDHRPCHYCSHLCHRRDLLCH